MHLVLCHVGDASAVQAYRALEARAPGRVDCVTVEALCAGLAWEHRLGSTSTTFRVRLADGRVVDGEEVDSVLNRVHWVAPVGTGGADARDGAYAMEEFTAFFLSWMAGLEAVVVNEPTPQGLAGRHRTPVEWAWLARESGLPIVPGLWTARATANGDAAARVDGRPDDRLDAALGGERWGRGSVWACVVGDRVIGPRLQEGTAAACIELAHRARVGLLGVLLDRTTHGVAFAGATPLPHLPVGEEGFVDALCRLLQVGEPG